MSEEKDSLAGEVKRLVEKLDAPRKKEWSEKISALTPFLSTVLLAAVSLGLTWSNQQGQMLIAQKNAEQQKAFQDSQVRAAEIDAISKLIPALTSNDPIVRKRADELLQAVQKARPIVLDSDQTQAESGIRDEFKSDTSSSSVITTFARIFEDDKVADARRIDAAERIAKAATVPGTPLTQRRRAEGVLSKVANSPTAPPSVRKAAQFAIANIRHVDASEIAQIIEAEPITRHIDEVILHHTGTPQISDYKGYPTILGIAKFQMETMQWSTVGFHYALAPDGTIWVGVPLNASAIHVNGRNETTVSVMLIMDGDRELPTPAQQTALVRLLKALFAKLNIKATDNFAEGHGFHSDYNKIRTCPGTRMTKELVLSWF